MKTLPIERIPTYSTDLIKQLDAAYPSESPSLVDLQLNPYKVAARSGQRILIEHLKDLVARGEDNILENSRVLDQNP